MCGLGLGKFDVGIGQRLRQERRLAGMTRFDLGNVLGVSADDIEIYECGRERLTASQLVKAADALDLSISMFFYDRAWNAADSVNDSRWVAIRRPAKLLLSPAFVQAAHVVRLWEDSRGELTEDIENVLLTCGILYRTIILRQRPGSSRLITEHFGSRITYLRRQDIVGREILEQPDRVYGAIMAEAYAEVLWRRQPIVEACRAIISTWDHKTIEARYDRVLLPWRWRGSDQFAMCISLRRGDLMEMDSTTAALPP